MTSERRQSVAVALVGDREVLRQQEVLLSAVARSTNCALADVKSNADTAEVLDSIKGFLLLAEQECASKAYASSPARDAFHYTAVPKLQDELASNLFRRRQTRLLARGMVTLPRVSSAASRSRASYSVVPVKLTQELTQEEMASRAVVHSVHEREFVSFTSSTSSTSCTMGSEGMDSGKHVCCGRPYRWSRDDMERSS